MVLSLGLILSNFTSESACSDCAYEYGFLQGAQAAYDQALIDEQDAYLAYLLDPTPYNLGVWEAELSDLNLAQDVLDDAQQAYADCLLGNGGGPIEDELLSSTVSILE
ncbi:MAG: hypothetical protein AAF394_11025 [Planctomycetota bacterium]